MDLQVGVKVLLKNNNGKILLLKRSEAKYGKTDGTWDIVGGRIDVGSTLMDNLKREVYEETQLPITSVPLLIAAQDIIRDEQKHVVRLTYTAYTEGEPILDTEENGDYRWLSFSELAGESDLDAYVRDILAAGLLTENSWN